MTNGLAEKACIITDTGGGMRRKAALAFARESNLVRARKSLRADES
jgi:hypothetical protein